MRTWVSPLEPNDNFHGNRSQADECIISLGNVLYKNSKKKVQV